MNIDILTTMQRSFGVHRKTGAALVARGLVFIDGEAVRLEGVKVEHSEVRGKLLEVPCRNLCTRPWGSPSCSDVANNATTGTQLTLS